MFNIIKITFELFTFQPKEKLQNLLLCQFSSLLSWSWGHHSSHACVQTCSGKYQRILPLMQYLKICRSSLNILWCL